MDVVSCETGTVKCEGKKVTYDIGGCLCFQGDYLKKDLELYEAKQGAWSNNFWISWNIYTTFDSFIIHDGNEHFEGG